MEPNITKNHTQKKIKYINCKKCQLWKKGNVKFNKYTIKIKSHITKDIHTV